MELLAHLTFPTATLLPSTLITRAARPHQAARLTFSPLAIGTAVITLCQTLAAPNGECDLYRQTVVKLNPVLGAGLTLNDASCVIAPPPECGKTGSTSHSPINTKTVDSEYTCSWECVNAGASCKSFGYSASNNDYELYGESVYDLR